jgi:integrase
VQYLLDDVSTDAGRRPMTGLVRVVRPVAIDPKVLERLLGISPLPVEHVDAPTIFVDGQIHTAASRWLLRKFQLRPVASTITSHASRLANYIAYLRNERGLDHPDPTMADVFAATEDDLRAFYRARQFERATAISSDAWRAQLSTIKQFHEFLQATHHLPAPFRITTFRTPVGTTATTAIDLRPRTRTASRGTPLTPGFAELLIQGALRIDRNGTQSAAKTVDRDAAAISLALGSGMRHGTLANITTYEIPPPCREPLTIIRVPDFITKGDAGGDAYFFSRRLPLIHAYVAGFRADLVADGPPYQPICPINIIEANAETWTTEQNGKLVAHRWAETDSATRRRLVNPDGSSPLLLLNAYKPTPLSYDQVGAITSEARDWTRLHLNADFPARLRTHDLRHTYATHLTVSIFKRAVAPHVHPDASDAYMPHRIPDAVEMAKQSLGHASEASTRLYNQHAFKLLDIPLNEFLGDF